MTSAQRSLALQKRDRIIEKHRDDIPELREEVDQRLRALSKARKDGIVDADDAMKIVDEMLTEPGWEGLEFDRRKLGGLWQDDRWTRVGYKASELPQRNARPIAQFRWED
jgi:hypothetical protein